MVYLKTDSETGKTPTAIVKLEKNGKTIEVQAEGDGQVDAACKAIGQAAKIKAKLISFNVSAITSGLDAQGDVTIQLEIGGKTYLGRGVSTDIVEASGLAYLNAINKSVQKGIE